MATEKWGFKTLVAAANAAWASRTPCPGAARWLPIASATFIPFDRTGVSATMYGGSLLSASKASFFSEFPSNPSASSAMARWSV